MTSTVASRPWWVSAVGALVRRARATVASGNRWPSRARMVSASMASGVARWSGRSRTHTGMGFSPATRSRPPGTPPTWAATWRATAWGVRPYRLARAGSISRFTRCELPCQLRSTPVRPLTRARRVAISSASRSSTRGSGPLTITSTVPRREDSGVAPNSVTFRLSRPGSRRSRVRRRSSIWKMLWSRWKRSMRLMVVCPCCRVRAAPKDLTPGSAPTTVEVLSSQSAGISCSMVCSMRAARAAICGSSVSG